jgi:hypothetical protein
LPPPLPDELVEEILLRLPPDEPKSLLRASVVCKTWGGAVFHHGFRLRLHELIPASSPPPPRPSPSQPRIAAPGGRPTKDQGAGELLLWDPITGDQQRVPVPAAFKSNFPIAAVFSAVVGCDHIDCHEGRMGKH